MIPPIPLPDKLFFKIGEVSRLTGVKPHVLRYWEEEFGAIRPQKSQTQQRLYRRKDLEVVFLIKKLLYEEKYTIAGAKHRLKEMQGAARNAGDPGEKQAMLTLRQAKDEILKALSWLEDPKN